MDHSKDPLSALQAMLLALQEAQKGAGWVAPNPLVGCVILDDQRRLLAKGCHRKFGGPHAEMNAIGQITQREKLKGAHLYCTLEPCAHLGKTPSCARFLAQLPLASVTYGLIDPNPLVSGKGLAIIRQAGIQVHDLPELKAELEELAEVFLVNIQYQIPFVALKVAVSLDGQMALRDGSSQWITSETARMHAHELRGIYDAVVIGRKTYELDQPSLNIRFGSFAGKRNKVILIDPNLTTLKTLRSSNIWKTHSPDELIVLTRSGAIKNDAINQWVSGLSSDGVMVIQNLEINSALRQLYQLGISSVLIEGGAWTAGRFLESQLVHRLYLYIAPTLIGGHYGLGWTSQWGVEQLAQKLKLIGPRLKPLGEDFLFTAKIPML